MSETSGEHAPSASTTTLVLGATGIVFGDIGTSPLYTIQECVGGPHGVPATTENVLGVLSLVLWSLTMVVTIKYLAFVMRADNQGEGGILALLALVPQRFRDARGGVGWLAAMVLVGAALLFGDGIITPAISVLSAMEGLKIASPATDRFVVPLTLTILVGLFLQQRRGTGKIGAAFGPVMVAWFTAIGALGLWHVAHRPQVLSAVSPYWAARFFRAHGFHAFRLLGSVVLAVTGGEALYADMGHFGRRAIRVAWLCLVFPALVLCYAGQCAVLLGHADAASQPFFSMVPRGAATLALVALAAPATVIASQALISGVFSLTHQAVRLGYFPRVRVVQTSDEAEGQIYVPALNRLLMLGCLLLVLVFRSSTNLAAAFGLAVSGTMAITSVTFFVVARHTWGWTRLTSVAVLALFLAFDLPFFAANLLKFVDGGYVPLLVGAGFFLVMVNWRRGRALLAAHYARGAERLDDLLDSLPRRVDARTRGTAVFLASNPKDVPPVLAHIVRRVRSLHDTVVLVTVTTEHTPFVTRDAVEATPIREGFFRVVVRAGFMEHPNVPRALSAAIEAGDLSADLSVATYFVGRETFLASDKGEMSARFEALFAFSSRNAWSAVAYFGLPPEQVVEVGTQIDL